MKYIVIISAALFFQNMVWADGTIQKIRQGQCTVKDIPAFSPFVPRPVENTVITGEEALEKVKSMKVAAGFKLDFFLDSQRYFEKVLGTDSVYDREMREGDCWLRAVLSDYCEELVSDREYKCAQICRFSYDCIDNRRD